MKRALRAIGFRAAGAFIPHPSALILRPSSAMRLLVVTDNRYYSHSGNVFDVFCFDRAFFNDYRAVFEEVRVMARMLHEEPPHGARRSDGDGVDFIPLPAWGGIRWMLGLPLLRRKDVYKAVREADAVCVRLPSVSGDQAFRAARKLGKPVMFELLGDPAESLRAEQHGKLAAAIGRANAACVREIARESAVGSYVSREHLQKSYPPGPRTVHDGISSIRLPGSAIHPARRFEAPLETLRLVLVASLVPVKCHDMLLRAVAEAKRLGAKVSLQLVGGGSLQPTLEQLAAELQIAEEVTFHGHVSGPERINAILDASDLFVMTSASEGMPRAIIEAMARGLPAAGTQAGGIAEILTPEQTVPVGDWQALGALLAKLPNAPARLTSWAAHSERTAREFAQETLSQKRQRLLRALRSKVPGG